MEVLLSNSDLHQSQYMDTLYNIVDYTGGVNINAKIKKIITEQNNIDNNIKEVLPLILYHFANKLA
tara:strand:- start:42 stop:239 length:198 start_codon:yes stop_codon:yes gene_type:complete